MLLNEIFEKPWELEVTDVSQHVYNDMKQRGLGNGGLFVWSKKGDPNQVIILINNKGYWEVHHAVQNNEGEFISGDRADPSIAGSQINTGLFATAIDLYEKCLAKGRRIRVTAPPDLWPPYNRAIERMVKKSNGELKASEPDENFIAPDNTVQVARTIFKESKNYLNISPMKILK